MSRIPSFEFSRAIAIQWASDDERLERARARRLERRLLRSAKRQAKGQKAHGKPAIWRDRVLELSAIGTMLRDVYTNERIADLMYRENPMLRFLVSGNESK